MERSSGSHRTAAFCLCIPVIEVPGCIDRKPREAGLVRANVEEAIPLPSESQNFVLAMNILEHLFDYRVCIRECFRVLKPSGSLIGVVPFLKNVHPDPEDYFRFTAPALERLFRETGFCDVTVESLGFGPVTAGVSQMAHLLRSRVLATGLWTVAILTDKSLRTLFRNARGTSPTAYPLGYFFTAKKLMRTREVPSQL